MWIDLTDKHTVVRTFSDARARRPNWSAPALMGEDDLIAQGFAIVAPTTPEYDKYTQTATETTPAYVGDVWVQQWNIQPIDKATIAKNLEVAKTALIEQIDGDVDAIYAKVVGNRATEYALAESDALAFKAAGYTGTAPSTVSSWSKAKGKTDKWAADDIIATANSWRVAQGAIRETRLGSKEVVKAVTSEKDIRALQEKWGVFVQQIKTTLGL